MGKLQHRLVGAVVVLGVLTALSVIVADLAGPDFEVESTSIPESRAPDEGGVDVANQTVPVTPPSAD